MPLVPGSRASFTGSGVVVTVTGSVLAAGGLDFASSGLATLTGTGSIVLGGSSSLARQIAVADGGHAVITPRIVGSDGFTKTGPGRLTITASSGVTGAVVVAGGTLSLGNGGATGSLSAAIRVDGGAVLAINRNNAVTLGNALSGSGSLVQMGPGVTTLTVANTISGTTVVQSGALRIEHPAALAASTAHVAGGRIVVADGVAARLAGLRIEAGVIDVAAGALSVAAGGIPKESLVAALTAGRGDGSWNGVDGIRSSAVAAQVAAGQFRSLGWIEEPDGAVRVAVAAAGDTNLDGLIDILDVGGFLASAAYDAGSPASWQDGDFNYDGIVDSLDVADLLMAGLLDQGSYGGSGQIVGVSAVPEPTVSYGTILTLTAAYGIVLRVGDCRRKRERRA
jgi:fibronectin-binding autotransporter adhesin